MNCPTPCPPCFGTPCPHFQSTSDEHSSNTLPMERQPTGYPIGSGALGIPCLRRRSSDIEQVLNLLNEVWLRLADLDNSRERSIALTKIEEAEMWLRRLS